MLGKQLFFCSFLLSMAFGYFLPQQLSWIERVYPKQYPSNPSRLIKHLRVGKRYDRNCFFSPVQCNLRNFASHRMRAGFK
ncbi:unnamed protein product, partial [Mesorhabditis belari]|uniref:Secreted protein n=1 Tax=Mesorhabditis belari TaxID=2138241 RepID=A0AAF3FFH8_9BILA